MVWRVIIRYVNRHTLRQAVFFPYAQALGQSNVFL